ncbi:MAG: dihydropteroate synthase, partial [bacterium]
MRRPRLIDAGFSVIVEEMRRMGVDPAGVDIMGEKGRHLLIRLDDVDLRAALILKQDMLSLGGEAALRREAASLKVSSTPVLLMGTALQVRRLAEKLPSQPFKLSALAGPLKELVEGLGTDARFLVGDRNLLEGGKKAVMGILNVTEDSFSDGGRYLSVDAAVSRGLEMLDEGADIIDVGGESTRPGAVPVSEDVEAERVVPVIRELAAEGRGVLSVDTTKSSVARKALEAGASIINDISGLAFDPFMGGVAAETGASVILMHTRGRPETMQDDLEYGDLMGEICSCLERAMDKAMEAGTDRERICVDPGIGFGKSP